MGMKHDITEASDKSSGKYFNLDGWSVENLGCYISLSEFVEVIDGRI